ncbi:uncharacterized protein LOC6536572 [Drosophila yakuba]|uniref:Uncharacterized protein n=1 Tax=Drosophila yakuba TaxID=7245 RepID=B4PLF3_DROYA|nr:uncharacterized protein LOC6536572 [Drosophila yakuba]EDW96860.1 uncharacterized protein Dyak_GE24657 [Drosophila yakuba]
MALVKTYIIDSNSIPWVLWVPPATAADGRFTIGGPQVVAFHFLGNRHGDTLDKWTKLLDELAQEYAGRILFGLRDISSIGQFNENLNPDDFGSYRKGLPPRIYGKDCEGEVYDMHKLVSAKYLREFCDQLLGDQLFRAVVLGATPSLDTQPRNFYEMRVESSRDMLVMLYDPACYYWPIQKRMLRKLVRLLASEDLPIVIVDKANNYLGVGFSSRLVNCHGSIIFTTPRRDGWNMTLSVRMESARGYLRYIAGNRQPELKDFDAEGEPRAPEHAMEYIQYLF